MHNVKHKNTTPSGQNLINLGEITTKSDNIATIPTEAQNLLQIDKNRTLDLSKYTWTVNELTLKQFYEANMFGSLRVYLAIQNEFSGNLHTNQIELVANMLNVGKNSIRYHLRNLIKFGFAKKETKNWTRIVGWRNRVESRSKGKFKFGSYQFYDPKTDEWVNNRPFSINSELLTSSEGLKYIRTFVYSTFFHRATQYSRKNHSSKSTHTAPNGVKPRTLQMKAGFFPVSASFVINCNDLSVTGRTIARHLKKANEIGEVVYMNEFTILSKHKKLKSAQKAILHIKQIHPFAVLRKNENKKKKWLVVEYECNAVKSNLHNLYN